MLYYIGCHLGGGIDPLPGFRGDDDLSKVHILNEYATTLGSEIAVSVPLWTFLDRNPDFYCYGGDGDTEGMVDVDDIRPKPTSEIQ